VRAVHPHHRGAAVLAASFLAHAAALLWLGVHLDAGARASDPAGLEPATGPIPLADGHAVPDAIAGVALVDERLLGELAAASPGPADQAGTDPSHPLPSASIDLPGVRAAGRGGGDPRGGMPSFTGRRDPDQLRSQIWNGLARYQVPHTRTGERSATPEALARLPRPGFDSRRSRPNRARDGVALAQAGDARGTGLGGRAALVERMWRDADPRLDSGPAPLQQQRQDGSTESGEARPLVDRGQTAVETERLGRASDATDAAAASSERDPMPLELTRASAGGREDDAGVRGARTASGAAPSPLTGDGTAATRAALATGSGRPSLRAQREDPYFRRMYQRLDSIIVYPPDRALEMDQGEVVVAFTLFANGTIGGLRIVKSSGFDEFDEELTRALRVAAPFGPVPVSLRGRSDRVGVTAPYKFTSPLIR